MGGFVSSPTVPGSGGWNLSNLFLPLPGVVGGFSWNNPSNQLLMYQSMGVLPPELQNWIRQLPAPEGTPTDMLQTTQWGGVGEIPKWFVQRFGDTFGFTESTTQPRTANSWWMDFLESPWKYLTGPAIATMSQPWQGVGTQTPPGGDGGLKPPTDPDRGTGNPTEPGDITLPPPPGVEPDTWKGIWDWFKSSFPDLWRTATQAQVLDKWYEVTQDTGGIKPPTDPNRQTGPSGEPTDWTVGAGSQTNPSDWGVVFVPPQTPNVLDALSGLGGSNQGGGGSFNFTPPEGGTPFVIGNPIIRTDVNEFNPPNIPAQFPVVPATTPTLPAWNPSGQGGYYNLTPPTSGTQVIYNPPPIGNPTLPAVPPVTPPNTTGGSTGNKGGDTGGKFPDLGGLAMGLAAGGGAGPPGMTAPVVGGGQTQSQFATPFAITPAPPTLMQFIQALSRGGLR